MKKMVKESLNENLYNSINEGFATSEGRKMEKLFNIIGYDDFEEFIGDNPGCVEVIKEWIDEYFSDKLAQEGLGVEELEELGMYRAAEKVREEEEEEEYEG